MKRIRTISVAILIALFAALAPATAAHAVANLDELLEQTRNAHEKEKRENRHASSSSRRAATSR